MALKALSCLILYFAFTHAKPADNNFEDADRGVEYSSSYVSNDQVWDIRHNIPGEPEIDYPVYSVAPKTAFTCGNRVDGYYADIDTRCQVFRICTNTDLKGDGFAFLCPNGTLFNQRDFVCDWYKNVDCSMSERYYYMNEEIGRVQKPQNHKHMMKIVQEMVDYPINKIANTFTQNPVIPSISKKPNIDSKYDQNIESEQFVSKPTKTKVTIPSTTFKADLPIVLVSTTKKSDTKNSQSMYLQNKNQIEEQSSKPKIENKQISSVDQNKLTHEINQLISSQDDDVQSLGSITDDILSNQFNKKPINPTNDLQKFIPPGRVYISSLGELSTDAGSSFDPKTSIIIGENISDDFIASTNKINHKKSIDRYVSNHQNIQSKNNSINKSTVNSLSNSNQKLSHIIAKKEGDNERPPSPIVNGHTAHRNLNFAERINAALGDLYETDYSSEESVRNVRIIKNVEPRVQGIHQEHYQAQNPSTHRTPRLVQTLNLAHNVNTAFDSNRNVLVKSLLAEQNLRQRQNTRAPTLQNSNSRKGRQRYQFHGRGFAKYGQSTVEPTEIEIKKQLIVNVPDTNQLQKSKNTYLPPPPSIKKIRPTTIRNHVNNFTPNNFQTTTIQTVSNPLEEEVKKIDINHTLEHEVTQDEHNRLRTTTSIPTTISETTTDNAQTNNTNIVDYKQKIHAQAKRRAEQLLLQGIHLTSQSNNNTNLHIEETQVDDNLLSTTDKAILNTTMIIQAPPTTQTHTSTLIDQNLTTTQIIPSTSPSTLITTSTTPFKTTIKTTKIPLLTITPLTNSTLNKPYNATTNSNVTASIATTTNSPTTSSPVNITTAISVNSTTSSNTTLSLITTALTTELPILNTTMPIISFSTSMTFEVNSARTVERERVRRLKTIKGNILRNSSTKNNNNLSSHRSSLANSNKNVKNLKANGTLAHSELNHLSLNSSVRNKTLMQLTSSLNARRQTITPFTFPTKANVTRGFTKPLPTKPMIKFNRLRPTSRFAIRPSTSTTIRTIRTKTTTTVAPTINEFDKTDDDLETAHSYGIRASLNQIRNPNGTTKYTVLKRPSNDIKKSSNIDKHRPKTTAQPSTIAIPSRVPQKKIRENNKNETNSQKSHLNNGDRTSHTITVTRNNGDSTLPPQNIRTIKNKATSDSPYIPLPGTSVTIAKSKEEGHFTLSNDPKYVKLPQKLNLQTKTQENNYPPLKKFLSATIPIPTSQISQISPVYLPFPTISGPIKSTQLAPQIISNPITTYLPVPKAIQSAFEPTKPETTQITIYNIPSGSKFYSNQQQSPFFNGLGQSRHNSFPFFTNTQSAQRRSDHISFDEKEDSLYKGVSSYQVPLNSVGRLPFDIQ